MIFVSVVFIRLSDLWKTKIKDSALEKYVGHQFEFPQQYIIEKNAFSLTQEPMVLFHYWKYFSFISIKA